MVVNQLTSLPQDYDARKAFYYESTNRVRREGRPQPRRSGPGRRGPALRHPEHRLPLCAGGRLGQGRGRSPVRRRSRPFRLGGRGAARARARGDRRAKDFDGLVLRYGQFYGPGTYYASDGGHFGNGGATPPLPDRRAGHGDASPSSTSRTPPGPPSPPSTTARPASTTSPTTSPRHWASGCPDYAEALGAKPPRHVPTWLAKLVGEGRDRARRRQLRGASNAKAKRELGWQPRYASWRQGFREALG